MPSQKVGKYTFNYTLFEDAKPDHAIHFGMNFTLTHQNRLPLMQLIFPIRNVGNNIPGRWNVDNHLPPGNATSLIFANASTGTIDDKPREIISPGNGILTTKFAVFPVDLRNQKIMSDGVVFGYSIDTGKPKPTTQLLACAQKPFPADAKAVVQARCTTIKF